MAVYSLTDGIGRPLGVRRPSLGMAAHEAARLTAGVPRDGTARSTVLVVEGDPGPPRLLADLRIVRAQAWGGRCYRVRDCRACGGAGGGGCSCSGLRWAVDTADVLA